MAGVRATTPTNSSRTAGDSAVWEDLDEALAHELADCLWCVMTLADAYDVKLPRELVLIGKQFLYVERYMKLLAPRWQMMTDPQLTGYFANFMVEVSREYEDPEVDEVDA